MSLRIAGTGLVTPLGNGVRAVWNALLRGEEACADKIGEEVAARSYPVFRVPGSALAGLPAHPRLRRASAISRFAALAGLEALAEAGVQVDPRNADRTALIFAISNGGVIYTKRFFREVVSSGAQSASPLLFPETVFNAPASHLAAILGITGVSYTLVGDGAVGLLAVKMAADLMANGALDYCLVVGAEEVDWLLCDAYSKWRLLRSDPPVEVFLESPKGMILSEGAGAILLARKGPVKIDNLPVAGNYRQRSEMTGVLKRILSNLTRAGANIVIASANGTFIDAAECTAISELIPDALVYTAKPSLGESVGAGALWQIIVGAQALISGELPPLLHARPQIPLRVPAARITVDPGAYALVSSCGLNQQVAGLVLGMDRSS
jgi:3-oxoacyl-(acyl-carrier-protein) synthase